jgi:signal transduction histidine kinase/HAMP domain-containing protein
MANTIRGKILLAFSALAAITGFLGLYAVSSVVESGRLVVHTYDKPLMSISYARLAVSSFTSMQLALAQRQLSADADRRAMLDARIDELARELDQDLAVAQERSSSTRAAAVAHDTARVVAEWNTLRRRLLAGSADGAGWTALDERAAIVIDNFDRLVELTAEDGFRDRERSLVSIETYRRLSIAATIGALLLGVVIAFFLARRMVRPIALASRAAGRIADGELNVEIGSAGGDELGQLLKSMAVMRDNIRDMMEREISARRSAQSRLVDAIECSTEGVILVDRDARILISNSQIAAFFPALAAEGFARDAPLPAALEAALGRPGGEMLLGDGRWLRLSRSGTADSGFVIIASDITALKERETVLQAAKDQAETASRAKSEFLANMSHELRTPLNAVIGFSEIIAGEMLGPVGQPKYKHFAADVVKSGRHLLELINDILDTAKLEAGKTTIHLEPISMHDIVGDSMRMVRDQATTGGVEMTSSIEEGIPLIDADATRLRQILLNLLSNAVKFTPAGGKITVTVSCRAHDVCIAVSDTGIGMDASDIPKALEPFGQIDSSISRKYQGTGLGLPLCKLLAELHGGDLSIESALGRGTTVTVVLPMAVERRAPLLAAM